MPIHQRAIPWVDAIPRQNAQETIGESHRATSIGHLRDAERDREEFKDLDDDELDWRISKAPRGGWFWLEQFKVVDGKAKVVYREIFRDEASAERTLNFILEDDKEQTMAAIGSRKERREFIAKQVEKNKTNEQINAALESKYGTGAGASTIRAVREEVNGKSSAPPPRKRRVTALMALNTDAERAERKPDGFDGTVTQVIKRMRAWGIARLEIDTVAGTVKTHRVEERTIAELA